MIPPVMTIVCILLLMMWPFAPYESDVAGARIAPSPAWDRVPETFFYIWMYAVIPVSVLSWCVYCYRKPRA